MEIKAIGCEPLSLKRVFIKDGHTLKVYQDTGGYTSLRKALGMSQDEKPEGSRSSKEVTFDLP